MQNRRTRWSGGVWPINSRGPFADTMQACLRGDSSSHLITLLPGSPRLAWSSAPDRPDAQAVGDRGPRANPLTQALKLNLRWASPAWACVDCHCHHNSQSYRSEPESRTETALAQKLLPRYFFLPALHPIPEKLPLLHPCSQCIPTLGSAVPICWVAFRQPPSPYRDATRLVFWDDQFGLHFDGSR